MDFGPLFSSLRWLGGMPSFPSGQAAWGRTFLPHGQQWWRVSWNRSFTTQPRKVSSARIGGVSGPQQGLHTSALQAWVHTILQWRHGWSREAQDLMTPTSGRRLGRHFPFPPLGSAERSWGSLDICHSPHSW